MSNNKNSKTFQFQTTNNQNLYKTQAILTKSYYFDKPGRKVTEYYVEKFKYATTLSHVVFKEKTNACRD